VAGARRASGFLRPGHSGGTAPVSHRTSLDHRPYLRERVYPAAASGIVGLVLATACRVEDRETWAANAVVLLAWGAAALTGTGMAGVYAFGFGCMIVLLLYLIWPERNRFFVDRKGARRQSPHAGRRQSNRSRARTL